MTDSRTIERVAAWISEHPDQVRAHLVRYYADHAGVHEDAANGFGGRFFEWHVARSSPERFTESDLLAVAALSVEVPARVAVRLLVDRDGRLRHLLASARSAVAGIADLRALPDDLVTAGPLVELYEVLRAFPGMGPVTTSKLLAAKFPAHVPIRDALVEAQLGLSGSDAWWRPIRGLLSDDAVAATLLDVALPDGSPEVTLLRRLDVALWMEERRRRA